MASLKSSATPLMEQYLKIKSDYQDTILLYRMGDFYETFYEDAKTISKVLGIALTKRAHGKSADVPLAGFPYHALDNYLHKLVNAGYRVAICEQIEDPKLAKGIVKRNVIEVVTPGATLSDKLLDHKANNFLAAIIFLDDLVGFSVADISTGEFYVSEIQENQIENQLIAFQPKEILVKVQQKERLSLLLAHRLPALITPRDDWIFEFDYSREFIKKHFQTHSLKGFGLDKMPGGVISAAAVLHYLKENNKASLEHIRKLRVLNLSKYMILDEATRRNLEIQTPLRENVGGNTLADVIDNTRTSMGARMIRKWLNQPLREATSINVRLDLVQEMYGSAKTLQVLKKLLGEISDLERLIGKISSNRANARDLINLKTSLQIIPDIKEAIDKSGLTKLKHNFEQLKSAPDIADLISKAIVDDPPLTITEGSIIKTGYNTEMDELKEIAHQGKKWIAQLQAEERKRTGISTLKINYNKVFGYYIEITKVNLDKKPDDYTRKQTLVNAERFITPDLKEKEEKILGAEEKLKSLEYELFQQIREQISAQTNEIQDMSYLIAYLDCLSSFAQVARDNNYVRPIINDEIQLEIKNGRHPVVERFIRPGEEFIPNDVYLDPHKEQIWIITGPNMAGKSTFLRQVGLIVFMAQIGCFVPAEKAIIGTVDRIFTRVGASDNLASGESTFLVEMNETANILNNASNRSLILLDEIGRGTSTFDGLAIAWAVSEFLHNENTIRAKTLFATHYHELTELALIFPRIRNYNIAVEEWENQIIFLRKILPGGTDNSYGIHVAEMAGLPKNLIERAREILANLEANELSPNRMPKLAKRKGGREVDRDQLSIFMDQKPSKVERTIGGLDINSMTPLDALVKLSELKKMIDKKE